MALQMENEAAYRQLLVQGVLTVLLPTEDLENDCLTTLVGQVLSEMILGGGIGGKACEPWLLWEGITKAVEAIQSHLPKSKAQIRVERSTSDLRRSIPLNLSGGGTKRWGFGQSIQKTFWLILQYVFLAFTAVRFIIITLVTSSTLPSRVRPTLKATGPGYQTNRKEPQELANTERTSGGRTLQHKQPIMKMKIWSCVSCLLDLDVRMPWLRATLSILQWGAITGPGEVGNTDGIIDK